MGPLFGFIGMILLIGEVATAATEPHFKVTAGGVIVTVVGLAMVLMGLVLPVIRESVAEMRAAAASPRPRYAWKSDDDDDEMPTTATSPAVQAPPAPAPTAPPVTGSIIDQLKGGI